MKMFAAFNAGRPSENR